jgi:glycosyltransferase involved in cell wall biosynthesis
VFGGIPVSTWVIARSMADAGHEVHVLIVRPRARSRDEIVDGVNVHIRPLHRSRVLARLDRWRRGRRERRSADHAFGFYDPVGTLVRSFALRREYKRLGLYADMVEAPDADGLAFAFVFRPVVPVAVNLRCPPPGLYRKSFEHSRRPLIGRFTAWLERVAVERAALVTSASPTLVERNRGVVDTAVELIYHTIDRDRFDVKPVEETGPVVLAVGRLEPVKAPETLVQAAAILAADVPGLEVVFLGAPLGEHEGEPYGEWIPRLARELHAPCTFVPHLPRDEVPEYYARARVVAVPSRWDTFPVAALEAMAAGRPVVGSTAIGTAALIRDHDCGAVVPADDPEALAAALRPFLLDTAAAARAGRAGRALLDGALSPATLAEARAAAYRRAARGAARRA